MKQYNNWEEIDKDTDGLVTSLTYIVLFVNDPQMIKFIITHLIFTIVAVILHTTGVE